MQRLSYDSILLNLSKPVFPFLCFHNFQALQEAIDAREESLLWLKSRLAGLSEVSSDLEVQRQRTSLAKLSTDLRALFSSLCQVFEAILKAKTVSFSCIFAIKSDPSPPSFTVG